MNDEIYKEIGKATAAFAVGYLAGKNEESIKDFMQKTLTKVCDGSKELKTLIHDKTSSGDEEMVKKFAKFLKDEKAKVEVKTDEPVKKDN